MVKNNKQWLLAISILVAMVLIVFSFFYLIDDFAKLAISENDKETTRNYSYLVSPDDSLTISDAIKSDDFINDNKVPVALGEQSYWHKFKVNNLSFNDKAFTLFFDNYVIAEIDIYMVDSGSVSQSSFIGNARWPSLLEQRALPSFSFELAANTSKTLYIRSQSKGSATLPIVLFDQKDFNNYKQYVYLLWGAFVGLIFIMAVYNLILYMGDKDAVYLFYVGYILTILIEMGLLHGFIVFLFPKEVVNFFTLHITGIHYIVGFFALSFALKFLKIDLKKDRTFKIGRVVALLLLPLSVSTVWMKEYQAVQIFFCIQGAVYAFIFYLLMTRFKDIFSWAKFYFISWMPIYIGGVITPLFFIGTLEYSFWVRNALLISVMLEAGLMAMALANRLRSNEERILYNATHDQSFGFANNALMSRVLSDRVQKQGNNTHYAIVVAEIQNYHSFSPYIETSDLKQLIKHVAFFIENNLKQLALVKTEAGEPELGHAFLVKDGIIGIAVNSCDTELIQKEIKRLNNVFPFTFESKTMDLSIHCVFGIALSTDGKYPSQIVSKALQVINNAKKQSQLVALYSSKLVNTEERKILLATELQKAIEQDLLELYHQPQILIPSQSIHGNEALLRWHHPTLGFIPPDEFVQIAEDTGIITRLTHWVIHHAFLHQKELIELGLNKTLSINISTLDVINDDLCEFIIESANQHKITPQTIVLEVTETANIYNQKQFLCNLTTLSDAGFLIAIDDFGTGYSSLSYLSCYPIHELKIDKSLILNLDISEKNKLIVKAILSMAKSLDLKVVAEGIENESVGNLLQQYGCEIAQGYFYAKPMCFSDYITWLKCSEKTLTEKSINFEAENSTRLHMA